MRGKPDHAKKLSKRNKTDLNPVHRQPKMSEAGLIIQPVSQSSPLAYFHPAWVTTLLVKANTI